MSPALRLKDVRSGYDQAVVIRDVKLEIQPGEIFAILGKNGMGKSTLLKTIMGFLPLKAGEVRIFGDSLGDQPPYLVARKGIAYTPQDQALFQDLTVGENLRLALRDEGLMQSGLERIGEFFPFIPQRLQQRAGTLSGGEQKMLLIARALMGKPRLMLIDEISEGMQPSLIDKLAKVLLDERDRSGTSILIIEQNLKFALAVADRYAVLKLGEIVVQGNAGSSGLELDIASQLSV
jgi:ABC-type branched-subunit amino acid transport system ATPase component